MSKGLGLAAVLAAVGLGGAGCGKVSDTVRGLDRALAEESIARGVVPANATVAAPSNLDLGVKGCYGKMGADGKMHLTARDQFKTCCLRPDAQAVQMTAEGELYQAFLLYPGGAALSGLDLGTLATLQHVYSESCLAVEGGGGSAIDGSSGKGPKGDCNCDGGPSGPGKGLGGNDGKDGRAGLDPKPFGLPGEVNIMTALRDGLVMITPGYDFV